VVKDSSGTVVDSNKIVVTGTSQSALAGTLKINGSTGNTTVSTGTALTLSVSATGGSGSYTYQYKAYDGSKWITLKGYTNSTTYTCNASAGDMKYVVVVKDSSGTVVDSNKIVVTGTSQSALAGTLKINGSIGNTTVSTGTTLTLSVSATGGSGSYTYQYKVYDGSKWLTLKSSTTATTYTYKLSTAGTYKYVVVVKDSSGTEVDSNKITITAK
jgi:LPS sulfotransferase NodH